MRNKGYAYKMNTRKLTIDDIPDFTQKELLDSYFDAHVKAINYTSEKILPLVDAIINMSDFEEMLIGLLYRIHLVASSLTRLNQNLDFSSVVILSRTIYEINVDIHLVKSANHKLVEQYKSFPIVERYKRAFEVVKIEKNNPDTKFKHIFRKDSYDSFVNETQRKSEIESLVKKHWGSNKKGALNWPNHWSGQKLKERVESLGKQNVLEYLEFYSMLSWHVHSGSASYAGLSPESLEGTFAIALEYARKTYLESILIIVEKLKLSDKIVNFIQETDSLLQAPTQFMIELGMNKLKTSETNLN